MLALALLLGSCPVAADENVAGRHRVSLGMTAWDAAEADSYTLLPGYTLALDSGLRLGLTTSLTYLEQNPDPALGIDSNDYNFGLGDSNITLQYDPSQKITASPWVPDTLGLVASVTAPTGDADKGLGRDIWAAALGGGWIYPLFGNLWLTPGAYYEWSFKEGRRATETEFGWVSTGILWISPGGFWIGYTPYFVRDLVDHEWSTDHALVIGKMWENRFGLSLDYGKVERIDDLARRDDWAAIFNFYYQFGPPP